MSLPSFQQASNWVNLKKSEAKRSKIKFERKKNLGLFPEKN